MRLVTFCAQIRGPLALLLTVAGCQAPTVSGDVGCYWSKPFDVTLAQYTAMTKDPATWRPLALQIKDHNDNRARQCDGTAQKGKP